MNPLDRIDAQLLNEVQRDNRLPSDRLGAQVGLSATGVQRRLKRLREQGVIEADVSVVSPKAVGRNVTMLVLVSLERERTDIIDAFKQAIRVTPEVMSGYYVTGDADFVLILTVRDMEEYEAFTRRFFYENQDIKWFKTMVSMDRVKAGLFVPVTATPDRCATTGALRNDDQPRLSLQGLACTLQTSAHARLPSRERSGGWARDTKQSLVQTLPRMHLGPAPLSESFRCTAV